MLALALKALTVAAVSAVVFAVGIALWIALDALFRGASKAMGVLFDMGGER